MEHPELKQNDVEHPVVKQNDVEHPHIPHHFHHYSQQLHYRATNFGEIWNKNIQKISCVYIIWNFMCVNYLEFHVCILFGIDLKNHPVTCFRMLQVGDRFS